MWATTLVLSSWRSKKLATEAKNYEKQQKEIAALKDFVNRNLVRASTTKRAQSRRKQLEKMERLDKPEAGKKSANMTFQSEKRRAILSWLLKMRLLVMMGKYCQSLST